MFSYDLAFIALETLWSKKGRNILSVLGIVIGVATIIIVVAIGIGVQKDIEEQFKNLSVTAISINPMNAEGVKSKLDVSDAEYIRENAEYVEAVTAMYQSKLPVSSQGLEVQFTVLGIDIGFFDVSNLNIIEGRIFTDEELEDKDRIVIIGIAAVDEFFDGDASKAIGENLTISKKRLEIV
ncbi:MAG: ABC transporter permease, partial [Candidatus Pacebacteria bacterium]|nr:ABC transporter permease [Candidatus Paceibacterota bacterium]